MTASLQMWSNKDVALESYDYMFGNGLNHFRRQGNYSLETLLKDIESQAKSPFNDYKAEPGHLFKVHLFEDEVLNYGFYALKVSETGSLIDWYRLYDGRDEAKDQAVIRGLELQAWPTGFYRRVPGGSLERRLRNSIR